MAIAEQSETTGRAAQRRRTRRAIVEATMALLDNGVEPSVNDIAAAAEVSRRTIYLHYPTLDQLILDAAIGLLNVDVDAALQRVRSQDPRERLSVLINELYATMTRSLPLGRKLIRLTVDAGAPTGQRPRRGHRRVEWIEWAIEPIRPRLTPKRFDDLISSLALVIGWEAFIVLLDVRGMSADAARKLTVRLAGTILESALATGRTRPISNGG